MVLTSVEYVRLIAWLAYNKCRITLGKTQMQKILFICYGLYLVANNDNEKNIQHRMFTDDTPKAWPFGPVFPRTYKRYREDMPINLTDQEKATFLEDKDNLKRVASITTQLCYLSARQLTNWSHQADSPWSKALLANNKVNWNALISDEDIYQFFSSTSWKDGLRTQ